MSESGRISRQFVAVFDELDVLDRARNEIDRIASPPIQTSIMGATADPGEYSFAQVVIGRIGESQRAYIGDGPLASFFRRAGAKPDQPLADFMKSLLPLRQAAMLVQRLKKGRVALWVDAENDNVTKAIFHVLMRESPYPVEIHDLALPRPSVTNLPPAGQRAGDHSLRHDNEQ